MLKIYNTLTRDKQDFKPIESNKVRMYVCGMTVYDYCHLGHARVLVVFDMVYRWLKASGYDVTYVRNITDIDDKIIKRAAENGESHFTSSASCSLACFHSTKSSGSCLSAATSTRSPARKSSSDLPDSLP